MYDAILFADYKYDYYLFECVEILHEDWNVMHLKHKCYNFSSFLLQ
jgi:hypothetical protein